SYAEPARGDHTAPGATAPDGFTAFSDRRREDDWPQQDGYRNGYPDQYPAQAPDAESTQADDVREQDSVGFDRPGPAASESHDLTNAGLPRRGSTANGTNGTSLVTPEPPASTPESNGGSGWRS